MTNSYRKELKPSMHEIRRLPHRTTINIYNFTSEN